MVYRNPVLPGFYPDPSVCRVGSWFYLVNSSFDFVPGIPIHRSRNLISWEWVGHVVSSREQVDLSLAGPSRGLFAPTIRYHNGTFYVAVTHVDGTGNILFHAADPSGPWSLPVTILQEGIDPSLFFDDDGTAYFCTNAVIDGQEGIALSVIDPPTGKILQGPRHICPGTGGRCPEAPHLYKRNGKYYLVLAEGGTEYGHMVTVFQGATPWGPFEPCPENPVLTHRDDYTSPIQCVGHADLVEDDNGRWWALVLGIRPLGPLLHNLGRETFLSPVIWTKDGWPRLGTDGQIRLEMEGPLPENPGKSEYQEGTDITLPSSQPGNGWRADFSTGTMDPEWTFIRHYEKDRYTVRQDREGITLTGNKKSLSAETGTPTFMARRQDAHECTFTSRLTLNPGDGEAGLTAYYNNAYHYEIFLRRDGEKMFLGFRRRIHDMESAEVKEVLPEDIDSLNLRIRADRDWYRFEYLPAGLPWKEIGRGMTAGLCTEGTHTMTFTGVFLGMYALNGSADFIDVCYDRFS